MKSKWNVSVLDYGVTFNDLSEKDVDFLEHIFKELGINYKVTANILIFKNGKEKYCR